MTKHCALCCENLILKFGSCASVVPLFRPTKNKEFLAKDRTSSEVVIADLARALGVKFTAYSGVLESVVTDAVLCKKCARKIHNCYALHREIKGAFDGKENAQLLSPAREPVKQAGKRLFHLSPSGLTPVHKKKPAQELVRTVKGRKSLFSDSGCNKEKIDDEISNLMNLPSQSDNRPCIVKVFFFYRLIHLSFFML